MSRHLITPLIPHSHSFAGPKSLILRFIAFPSNSPECPPRFPPTHNELHTLLFVPEIGPKSVIVRTLGIGGREFHVDGGNSLVVPQVVHSVATHRVQAGHLPRLSGGVVFGDGAKDVLGGALEGEEG